jgi:hypothetical protein
VGTQQGKDFEAPEDIQAVDSLKRDTTTLVMQATLRPGCPGTAVSCEPR